MSNNTMTIIIIILIVNYVLFCSGMYFLLRKEHKNKWLGLIPMINLFQYLKICELPFILIFIPLCNIVMLILSPIKLAKMYRCNIIETVFGLLIPTIFLNYIAFSDMTNKRIVEKNEYLPNQKSVDKLDRELIDLANGIYPKREKEYIIFRKRKKQKSKTVKNLSTQEYLDDLEAKVNNSVQSEDITKYEEVLEQIDILEEETEPQIKKDIETLDEINVDNIINSLDEIDKIEKKSIKTEKQDTGIDNNEYEEYKAFTPSNEAIAFGGEEKKENTYSVQSKKDDLKCSRCGSSLVGAKGYCPGCGAKI